MVVPQSFCLSVPVSVPSALLGVICGKNSDPPSLHVSQSKIKILRSTPADQAARRGHRLWQNSKILIKPCDLHEAFMPLQKPENSRLHTGLSSLIQLCEAFPQFSPASSLIVAFPCGVGLRPAGSSGVPPRVHQIQHSKIKHQTPLLPPCPVSGLDAGENCGKASQSCIRLDKPV